MSTFRQNNVQGGFSLIELVIVIVILGILAATALPRFLDVTDEAKVASMEGVAGGFATGVSLVRAQWESEARPQDAVGNVVIYDTVQLYLTTGDTANGIAAGYPLATSANVGLPIDATRCLEVWEAIFQNPSPASTNIGGVQDNGYYVATAADPNGIQACAYYQVNSLVKSGGGYTAPSGTDVGNNFTYQPQTGQVLTNVN
ncbi:type II secretion system protein [Aliagarivorans taiwanensis]|uniref:type II secretion system protein n=1 Tax=Aliagarivorans taiwanensis TaxID=561966 RepID=UPI00041C56D5|nr:prepilin-type N-terminal cleavage/methylation domain-containing protein [Aliagarivorans taiwanensis]